MEAVIGAQAQVASEWRIGAVKEDGAVRKVRCRRTRTFKSAAKAVRRIRAVRKSVPVKGKKKALKPASASIEVLPQNFGRTRKGNILINQEMRAMLELDKTFFAKHPAFDASNGLCRLKILVYSSLV